MGTGTGGGSGRRWVQRATDGDGPSAGPSVTFVLNAGAFVAVERRDRRVMALIKRERLAQRAPRTHGGVVGQVWRGGPGSQANVAGLLAAVDTVALDDALGRQVGVLLARTGVSDVIDAAVVLIADDDDIILTSDPDDPRLLADAGPAQVEIVAV